MPSGNSSQAHAPPGPRRDGALLVASLLLAYAAEAIGAVASVDAVAFYGQLSQPAWAPPPWVFGPVWTLLYTLMAVSFWRVLRQRPRHTAAMTLFLVQLGVNALWSWLFFRWHLGAVAFGWIVLLLGLIIATLASFWRISRAAAVLLVPYLGWVAFASVLSWAIWRANPSVLG